MSSGSARVSITVGLGTEQTFDLFTTQIDRWWRRGIKFRNAGARRGLICIEPRLGGRLFESIDGDPEPRVIEIGRITAWNPPRQLTFSWRGVNYAPHESTEVSVDFSDVAGGTLVTLTHRGLTGLPPDHPARHGLEDASFIRMVGLWWGEQMTSLRELARPDCAG
jgi:hypothetical protein